MAYDVIGFQLAFPLRESIAVRRLIVWKTPQGSPRRPPPALVPVPSARAGIGPQHGHATSMARVPVLIHFKPQCAAVGADGRRNGGRLLSRRSSGCRRCADRRRPPGDPPQGSDQETRCGVQGRAVQAALTPDVAARLPPCRGPNRSCSRPAEARPRRHALRVRGRHPRRSMAVLWRAFD